MRKAQIDALIDGLIEGGAERGQFTLAREESRQKLREFQLANPHAYVLELVQAAVAKGASRIEFRIDADDMIMRFDGPAFELEDFEDLYPSVFARQNEPGVAARRQLALGLNAAMALKPRYARVISTDGLRATELELRRGQPDRYRAIDSPRTSKANAWVTTLIHVKGRLRLRLLSRFVENLLGRIPEEAQLRERCLFSPASVVLEGEELAFGLHLSNAVGLTEAASSGGKVLAGFSIFDDAPVLHVVHHGVWIASHRLSGFNAGFVAVIDGSHLRKDLSQADVVMDEAYDELVEELRGAERTSIDEHDLGRLRKQSAKAKAAEIVRASYGRFAWGYAGAGMMGSYLLWGSLLTLPELGIGFYFLMSWLAGPIDGFSALLTAASPYLVATSLGGLSYLWRHWRTRRAAETVEREAKNIPEIIDDVRPMIRERGARDERTDFAKALLDRIKGQRASRSRD